MTIPIGEGLGAAGTRVTKRLGVMSELWIYIRQAVVGSLAIDFVLFGFLVIAPLAFGWWTVPIVYCLAVVLAFFLLRWWGIVGKNLALALGVIFFTIALGIGLDTGREVWDRLWFGGRIVDAIKDLWEKIFPPIWVMIPVVLVGAFAALKRRLWWYIGTIIAIYAVFLAYQLDGDDFWFIPAMWGRFRYITPVFYIAPGFFALTLAYVMFREMLLPNLEVTAAPLSWADIAAVGWKGLIAPGTVRYGVPRELPPPARTRYVVKSANGRSQKHVELPDTPAWFRFAQAVSKDACGFNEADAINYGVDLRDQRNDRGEVYCEGLRTIRARLIDAGLAHWINENHHASGVILHPEAYELFAEHKE